MREDWPAVIVEFYGVPRLRAGRESLIVNAATVGDVLAAVEQACPQLIMLVTVERRLNPQYLVSINGEGFVTDLRQTVQAEDRVLLLSADAGG